MSQDKIATALLDELWDAGFKLNGPECDKVDEIGRRIEGEHAVLLGLRLPDGRRSSCEGFRDGDIWRDVCAVEIEDAEVIGWAELPGCPL